MTPQENSMLEDLVRKVGETQLTEKDPEADQLLRQELGRDPDAVYKLAQTVLVQNLALNQARAQIREMQQTQQQVQPARATSFLGGLLGHRDPPMPTPPQYQQVPSPQPPGYQAPPQYAISPPYAGPGPSPAGSFLRSAATTAVGIAGGALVFEGIESLMRGFGHGSGEWSSGFGSGAPSVGETVVNNYYDDPRQAGGVREHHEHETSYDDDRPPADDAGLEDASYQPDTDPTSLDDSQTDDFDNGFGQDDDSNFS
jgi:hypothetical protein